MVTQRAPIGPDISVQIGTKIPIAERLARPFNKYDKIILMRLLRRRDQIFEEDGSADYPVRIQPGSRRDVLRLTKDQLNGRSCVHCGGWNVPMVPIGVVESKGSPRIYACASRCAIRRRRPA